MTSSPPPTTEIGVADIPVDAAMLDVREDDEWTAGHAPAAVHVPMSQLVQRLDEIPDSDPLFVICRSGGRSAQVVSYLNRRGGHAINAVEGMAGWAELGRPVETDPGVPGTVL